MNTLFTISTQSYQGQEPPDALNNRVWDIAIIGNINNEQIDTRSSTACSFASSHAQTTFRIEYIGATNQLLIDGEKGNAGMLRTKLKGAKSLLIEATTLSCPEILKILNAANQEEIHNISFLYLEPKEYRRKIEGRLTDMRDFDLNENRKFVGVRGFMANIEEMEPKGKVVFFLGYEKSRLGQAFAQLEKIQEWPKACIFGIPAFQPSWEIDSIANNVHHLCDYNFEILYAAASSVEAPYLLLNKLAATDKAQDPILIAPLGTKPHTIAACLFLIEHNEDRAFLLYDHPLSITGRSSSINRWHLYEVSK